MWEAVITITLIALLAGIGLAFAQRRLPPADGDLVEKVNELLPQTQCGQCGHPGCRPYAEAIAQGDVQAVNYFVAQKYVEALAEFARGQNTKTLLLPVEATGILSSLAGITEVAREAFDDAPRKGER